MVNLGYPTRITVIISRQFWVPAVDPHLPYRMDKGVQTTKELIYVVLLGSIIEAKD